MFRGTLRTSRDVAKSSGWSRYNGGTSLGVRTSSIHGPNASYSAVLTARCYASLRAVCAGASAASRTVAGCGVPRGPLGVLADLHPADLAGDRRGHRLDELDH